MVEGAQSVEKPTRLGQRLSRGLVKSPHEAFSVAFDVKGVYERFQIGLKLGCRETDMGVCPLRLWIEFIACEWISCKSSRPRRLGCFTKCDLQWVYQLFASTFSDCLRVHRGSRHSAYALMEAFRIS